MGPSSDYLDDNLSLSIADSNANMCYPGDDPFAHAPDPNACYPGDEPDFPAPHFDGINPATGTTERPSRNVDAPLHNTEGDRSSEAYNETIEQFAVEHNKRYSSNQQGKQETYCNIFASDVTRAMGAEIPHRIDQHGNPVDTGGNELTANDTVDWIHQHGAEHGWHKVTAEEAQRDADEGDPAVALWKKPGGIGHEMVVRPEDAEHQAKRGKDGHIVDPVIAQAGAQNKDHAHVGDIFTKESMGQVEYWVHE